jgi:ATP-binding cassette, subfamily G (WHITE), member 2, PDR
VTSLIVGSVFYGTPNSTAGFQAKGATLFFAVLINALSAITEINNLYAQRPIVEKHKSYAFYHPWTEAMAGIVLSLPVKFIEAVCFNLVLYFMAGLRREPSQFFIFFMINYFAYLTMSAIFRTLAAATKSIAQAMAMAGVMILAIVVYTGFAVPIPYMHPWFSWIRFLNPVFYAFEILVANEFHGRNFTCANFVPAGPLIVGDSFVCASRGAIAGAQLVNGDDYIASSYRYSYSHVWRNFGIMLAFMFGFIIIYLVATELNSSTSSTAEALVFRRGHVPQYMQPSEDEEVNEKEDFKKAERTSEENPAPLPSGLASDQEIFTWKDVVYDIEIKGEPRRLLDQVSGWVKPGTLTALMGTSGAGKTTLLDVS